MVSSLRTSAVHLVFCTLLRCGFTGVMAKSHECMRTYSCISISACKTAHCWHYAKCATLWPRPDAAGSASTEACLYHFATLSCIRSKNIITRTFFFLTIICSLGKNSYGIHRALPLPTGQACGTGFGSLRIGAVHGYLVQTDFAQQVHMPLAVHWSALVPSSTCGCAELR